MVTHNKEEIFTKIMAVVALATLIFVALSLMMVPNEGKESPFDLMLKAGEPPTQYVGPGEFTTFNMELTRTEDDTFDHYVELNIVDQTYGGGSNANNWNFEFTDRDEMDGDGSVYKFIGILTRDVTLEVTFLGTEAGETVTFTITGTEDKNEENGNNDTRLTTLEGSGTRGLPTECEHLTVASTTDYNPFVEPTSCLDRENLDFTDEATFSVTLWNLGSQSDDIYISEAAVWQELAGEDVKNDNFDFEFEYTTGLNYTLGQKIPLDNGDFEEIKGKVIPTKDNEMIPEGEYYVQITVDSDNGEPSSTALHGDVGTFMIDFSIVDLVISESEVEDGDEVTFTATIGINWGEAGNVAYVFYADDDKIKEGSVSFTESDTNIDVTFDWEAETGDEDERTIKVVVDPDDAITEDDEDNNEAEAPLEVAEAEAFPVWIIAIAIAAVVVAGGAYWFIAGGGGGGNVKIEQIIIKPDPSKVGDATEIIAKIKNDGVTFPEGDRRNIVISYYVDYESIGEKTVDLTIESFESGSSRELSLAWEPDTPGIHNLNVAVDIDEEESDVTSRDVEIEE